MVNLNLKDVSFQNVPFSLIEKEDSLAQMGLIVLETDLTIESEIHHFLSQDKVRPKSISLLHTRIPCDDKVTTDNLAQMEEKFETALKLFPKNHKFDVIGYGCTSASMVIGEKKVEKIVKSHVKSKKVTTPMASVKSAFKLLNVKRIGYLAPYISEIAQNMCCDLNENGFEIVVSATFGEDKDSIVGNISPQSILDAIDYIVSQQNDIEAVFVACTSLKCAPIISFAEKKFKIPVISSNSALAWNMARLGKVEILEKGKGSLFNEKNVNF